MSVVPPATIRAATRDDRRTIRKMVRKAHLDPTDVHWPHFLVAEQEGVVVGIGQVRHYRDCRELGSLVVRDDRRGQGIGGQIIEALLARHHGEVFLECRTVMVPYYRHFGFEQLVQMPADALAFPVFVGRQDQFVDFFEQLPQLRNDLLLAAGDHVERLKIIVHIDTQA